MSYEFRMLIVVIRSSVVLLYRVIDSENIKGNNVFVWVDYVLKIMVDLIEILFWLGRNEEVVLFKEKVNFKVMVEVLS